jgi:hypothetical protein
VHLNQMHQNRLDYNENEIIWKRDTKSPMKVYKRHELNEGAANLEWENEAYKS